MKYVILKTTMAGPDGVHRPDERIKLDDAIADLLIAGGYAVEAPSQNPVARKIEQIKAKSGKRETASRKAPETAVDEE